MLKSRNVTHRHMERALLLENGANMQLTWPLRAKPGKVVGTQHGLREEDAGEWREGGCGARSGCARADLRVVVAAAVGAVLAEATGVKGAVASVVLVVVLVLR
jgi:hypothetical protein